MTNKKHIKPYLPIEDYGIIGNLHTAALISLNGSIDFMSFVRFDSPTIFCSLLDAEKGGQFAISPLMSNMISKQMYIPDTNILVTRFFADEGIAELIDFMPLYKEGEECKIIRKVTTIRGNIDFNLSCAPRFNYARSEHNIKVHSAGVEFQPADDSHPPAYLYSDQALQVEDKDVVSEFRLREGETAYFLFTTDPQTEQNKDLATLVNDYYFEAKNFWQDWVRKITYNGEWQDEVRRSALALKLLICKQHGSMIAAATFSLPEGIGSQRNWDYRFTWIRDAAFAMHSFLQLGLVEEAQKFLLWTMRQSIEKELQLMFAIDGNTEIHEYELNHLDGYKGSKPVRIGNDAYKQKQMDIYGELLETVYLYTSHGGELTFEYWQIIKSYIEHVINNWCQPDHSIWEVRAVKREFLFSRLMCWVALDRAIKIGNLFSYPYDMLHWHQVRDEIFNDIYENFWNEEKQSFVQYKGGNDLDASVLLMSIFRFISPASEKWIKTMEAIDRDLRSDVLVYRYHEQELDVDGLSGREGTFSICSFWYVECLAMMGQTDLAKEHFEKMLGYANHLGLFSEQIGMKGEQLGNFPQAFTHLALISAALQLDYNLKGGKRKPPVY